ncbi:MAG: sugar ABC transporter permease [Spirochaetaceae bacterium 4572_59]|nr:MAG: sugar ABC transporter permease [Spirochaetaceae bacterium 4572_59]
MFPTAIQKRAIPVRALYVLGVLLILMIWLLPMIAIISTSIRPGSDISAGNYWGVPSRIAIRENYSEVFNPDRSPMLRYFINSTVMTLPAVFFAILFSSMAGFALAVYPFKGRVALYAMFIAGNFIPYQILMIPVRTMFVKFGLFDTIFGLVLFHTAFQSGFATFFLRNFIVELPFSLIESARVEGATEPRIFFSIIIPLLRPALASLGVLLFTFIWNDFFWALTLVQSDKARPITFGLSALKGQWLISYNLIAAGSIVAALPSVLVFFVLQKQFIQGLTFGGVKE